MCFGSTQQGPTNYGLQSQTTNQTSNTTYDPWVTQTGQNVVGQMQNAVAANPAQQYTGPTQAAFGNQWGTAGDYLTQALASGGPSQLQGAGNAFSSFLSGIDPNAPVSSYMDPYVQATLQPTIQNINLQRNQQGAENARAATMAGQYGGTGMGVNNALTNRYADQAIGNASGQAYSNAYNSALQTRNNMMSQFLQGASGLGGVGSSLGQYGANVAGALGGMGAKEQAAGQTGITTDLASIKQNALLPVQQLSPLAAALGTIPKNSTTNTQGTTTGNTSSSSNSIDNSGYGMLGSLASALLMGI
jgi:hypothetical protein